MATILASAVLSYALSRIGTALTEEPSETPLIDDKPATTSKRGSYIPRNFGVNRFGAVIAWVGRRRVEITSGAGGKGQTPGTGSQQVFFEDASHFITVSGSDNFLEAIQANGEIVFNTLLTEANTSSGSSFIMQGEDFTADFKLYFGEDNQPINIDLADPTGIGVPTRFPNVIRIDISNARLGGFAQWPTIEYVTGSGPRFTYLTRTSPYMTRGLGAVEGTSPSLIGEVSNSSVAGNAFIKIPDSTGDKALDFSGNYALIRGQLLQSLNRGFKVLDAYHTANEQILIQTGSFGVEPNLPAPFGNPWVLSGIANGINSGIKPPQTDSGVVLGTPGVGSVGMAQVNLSSSSAFSDFRDNQKLVFYTRVRNLDNGFNAASGVLVAGFELPNGRSRYVNLLFSKSGGISIQSVENGVSATIEVTGVSSEGRTFYKVELNYSISSGSNPPVLGESRVVTFRHQGPIAAEVYLSNTDYLIRGTSNLFTGVTTITLNEPVTGLQSEQGTVQPGVRGGENSARGLNVAAIIAEILFSPKPWGCGRPQSIYSLEALEVLGELMLEEGVRCNLPVLNGQKWDGILQSLYQNFGLLHRWNQIIGKYEIVAVRDTDPIITIPKKAIQDPLPEHQIATEAALFDKIGYTYRNRLYNYKEDIIAPSDDRYASFRNTSNQKKETLLGITDVESATIVVRRRADLEVAPNGIFNHLILRKGRNLMVANRFIVEGEPNFIFRIIKVTIDVDTSVVAVQSMLDSYGYTPNFNSTLSLRGSGSRATRDIQPDKMFTSFEIPSSVSGRNQTTIGFVRIRDNASVGSASFYTSKDDSGYWVVAAGGGLAAGGILTSSINLVDDIVNITYTPVGVDDLNLIRNITDAERDSGNQWCLIGSEIFKVKGFSQIDSKTIQLTGVVREGYGPKETHDPGKEVYIFDPRLMPSTTSESFEESATSYFKAVPKGGKLTLASVQPQATEVSNAKLST